MLSKIQSIFVSITEKVENNPTPISQYFFLFVAILAVRLALEFFSSQRLFTLDDIIHIGLWFTFIVLAFLLQLHIFSGENIIKISKLVVTFFTIALTAPIIDLIITQGIGAKMNYLSIHSLQDVFFSYLTLGGISIKRGATLGIRIEIFLLVVACFNYIRTKRNSLLWGFLGAWCVYTILFISGTVPFILGQIIQFFNLQYASNDQSTILMLLNIDLFLLLLLFIRYNSPTLLAITKQAPWASLILGFMHFLIGITFAIKNYPDNWKLNPTNLFWFPLFIGIFLCMLILTGIYRTPNSLSMKKISKYILGILAVICAMIDSKSLFLMVVIWGLLFLLNDATLALKNIPILRNIMEAMTLIACTLFGFCTFGAPMIGFPSQYLLVLWIATSIGGLFTEIGRRNIDIFPWYNSWHLSAQKYFRWTCLLLLLSAYFSFAYLFVPFIITKTILVFLVSIPSIVLCIRPKSTQAVLFACLPAYFVLLFCI